MKLQHVNYHKMVEDILCLASKERLGYAITDQEVRDATSNISLTSEEEGKYDCEISFTTDMAHIHARVRLVEIDYLVNATACVTYWYDKTADRQRLLPNPLVNRVLPRADYENDCDCN